MPPDVEELPADINPDLTIVHSIYCGRCGHDLRYSRWVGRCNDCGHAYNARPLIMQGIFHPHEHRVPLSDTIVALLCFALAFFSIRGNLNPIAWDRVVISAISFATGILYTRMCVRAYTGCFRARGILRRIRQEHES